MQKPIVIAKEIIYRDPYSTITRVKAEFGGRNREYFVNDRGVRSAVVVARNGEVLLTRQYRFLIEGLSWEIPGGRVDAGEDPQQAAVRECLEETGFRCDQIEPLITFQPGLDALLNPTHIFQCTRGEQLAKPPTDGEVVESGWVPVDECMKMVASGEIVDALSIIGLLDYATRSREI